MNYDEIENAFFFVSGAPPFENSAVVHRVSGEVFYASLMAGIDEIPEDAEDDNYLWIPHKSDLDLGKSLVMDFVRARCEDEIETVLAIFQGKGAYGRFKDLLTQKGLLEEWYAFEEDRTREALLEWCAENGVVLEE